MAPGVMILTCPCTGSFRKCFGFWVYLLMDVGDSAGMAVQINRNGVIDRPSQGALGKSRRIVAPPRRLSPGSGV
jgi:hypothetical protein